MAGNSQVTLTQLVTVTAGAVAAVLALSSSCDRAIEQRIDSVRRELQLGDRALDERLDLIERGR